MPFYRLPDLHDAITHELPPPNTSIFAAFAELDPAPLRQRIGPDFHLLHPLPVTAKPYQGVRSDRAPT